MIELSIAKEFTKTPGFRYRFQSPDSSGQQFREDFLGPSYIRAKEEGQKLNVILDGTAGYLTSFLEEAFGGLKRDYPTEDVMQHIIVTSNDEKHWEVDIQRYVKNALDRQG